MSSAPALPAGWITARLDDLFATITDGDHQPPPQAPTGVPFVVIGNIRNGSIDLSDARFVKAAYYESLPDQKKPAAGDLLYTVTGSFGIPVVVGTDASFCVQRHIAILKPDPATNVRYVALALSTNAAIRQAAAVATGTAQKTVGLARLRSMSVPLAPMAEQQRIVETLDSLLSRLDAASANLAAAQRKLKAYRASVLKTAVEGRLVPTDAELAPSEGRSYESAGVLLERILRERRHRWEEAELAKMNATGKAPNDDRWKAKYQEPIVPSVDTLPSLPEGWCWSTVEQLAGLDENALCDGPFGSNLKTEHYTDVGPRVIRLQNIGDGDFQDEEAHVSDEHFERLKRHAVRAGDIVVASLGTELPRACQVPLWLGPAIVKADCLRFNVNDMLADPRFVLHALNASPTRKCVGELVHGVGRPRIGLTLFRQTPIPLPPRAEQERIADHVEQLLSVARAVHLSLAAEERRSKGLRQAVLKWAFEGRLVDQDACDESADVLLARIRAERTEAAIAKPKQKPSRRMNAAS